MSTEEPNLAERCEPTKSDMTKATEIKPRQLAMSLNQLTALAMKWSIGTPVQDREML